MIAYRWILIIGLTLNTAGLAGANTRHCELAPRQNAYASNAVQSFDLSVESDAVVVTHMKLTDSALLGLRQALINDPSNTRTYRSLIDGSERDGGFSLSATEAPYSRAPSQPNTRYRLAIDGIGQGFFLGEFQPEADVLYLLIYSDDRVTLEADGDQGPSYDSFDCVGDPEGQ